MQDLSICICKRVYKNKHAAMKALKQLDRRINKRIEREKSKKLAEYYDDTE